MDDSTPPPVNQAALNLPGSRWPLILGIIAIVFGVGGLLQGVVAPFSVLMTESSMQTFAEQGAPQEKIDSYLEKLVPISYSSAAIYGILGTLLLTAGILLIQRKKVSPILLQIWSILKIVGGGYLVFATLGLQGEQMEIMFSMNDLNDASGTISTVTETVTKFMMVFQLLWVSALPVFFLIWFNRGKIKDQVEAW